MHLRTTPLLFPGLRIQSLRAPALWIAIAIAGATQVHAATITPFTFVTNASTDAVVSGLPAPQGDVRLDSVVVNGVTFLPAQLQVVTGATIVVNNGFDPRGGHILASGRGIGSALDPLTSEGPATVTPTSNDLRDSQANFNLSSITVTREVLGTAFVDYTFDTPTNTFFYWERGIDSDAIIQALDADHNVIASFKILHGNETHTGIRITTENGAFNNNGQELGSIGFQTDTLVSEVVVTSTQFATGASGGDNGPDYKILAASGAAGAVPEPASLAVLGLGGIVALVRRRTRKPNLHA